MDSDKNIYILVFYPYIVIKMAVPLIALAQYVVAHQIPLFLLAFGIIFLVIALAFMPYSGLTALVGIPVAILTVAVALGWFTMTSGGIMNMPLDVMQVVGVGIVFVIMAKMFGGIIG